MALYRAERDEMSVLPSPELVDLLHRAEELMTNEDYSTRVAAEIVRCAATLILEEREK